VRGAVAAIAVAVVTQGLASEAFIAYADAAGETAFAAASETGTVLTTAGQSASAAAGGFAAGGVSGGNIESAIAGAFQAVALFGVGESIGHGGEGFGSGTHATRIVAHSVIGCVSSGVQGGSCGQGAAGAGFSAFAGPVIRTDDFAAGLAGHAVAGGIGATVAGGKFGNGALTGAFGYLFNAQGKLRRSSEIYENTEFSGPKPDYHAPNPIDNNKHTEGMPRPNATPAPSDAQEVYRKNAIPIKEETGAYLGVNAKGVLYKFHSDSTGRAHFSRFLTTAEAQTFGWSATVKVHEQALKTIASARSKAAVARYGKTGVGGGGFVSGAGAIWGVIAAEELIKHFSK
jgi:hypothetical protein